MKNRVSRSRGFTILDLLATLGIGVVLTTLAVCVAAESGEAAKRAECALNLGRIGQAMIAYSNTERNGGFPRGKYDMGAADRPAMYTAVAAKGPFGADGPINDVTGAMYLLTRNMDITPKSFVCPSTDQKALTFAAGTTVLDFSNFPNKKCLSYSLCNPFAGKDGLAAGFKWNNTLPPTFALAGDKNPGGDALIHLTAASAAADLRNGNSRNHNQDGQNVLCGDGHVEFTKTPFCGTDQDNIYTYGESGKTAGGTGVNGPPMTASDNVLLPTADDDAAAK
jgi:hypothetical protein